MSLFIPNITHFALVSNSENVGKADVSKNFCTGEHQTFFGKERHGSLG